jgi:DNA-binding response OmpR family regulator
MCRPVICTCVASAATMRRSVLIIDDDRDVSKPVAAILKDAGFAIVELSDHRPEEVRAEVGRVEPDVVLLDG